MNDFKWFLELWFKSYEDKTFKEVLDDKVLIQKNNNKNFTPTASQTYDKKLRLYCDYVTTHEITKDLIIQSVLILTLCREDSPKLPDSLQYKKNWRANDCEKLTRELVIETIKHWFDTKGSDFFSDHEFQVEDEKEAIEGYNVMSICERLFPDWFGANTIQYLST